MVGHVLANVDARTRLVAAAQQRAFERWNSEPHGHSLYRDFILDERNALLKEYRSCVSESARTEIIAGMDVGERFTVDENLYRPIMAGPWAGEDARDVLKEAIMWWAFELDKIDYFGQKESAQSLRHV